MLKTEDTALFDLRPSCTQDEAVAKMLGWLRGSTRLQKIMVMIDGLSDSEQLPYLPELPDPVAVLIQEFREQASKKYIDAVNAYDFELALEMENEVKNWEHMAELASRYMIDIADELSQPKPQLRIDQSATLATGEIHITLKSLHQWALKTYEISILDNQPLVSDSSSESKDTPPAEPSIKPWLVADPNDPKPEQPWYTPARYFARQLIIDDSTLLIKRDLLAQKVGQSLTAAGFMKRGGVKPLDPATIKKAFSKVGF